MVKRIVLVIHMILLVAMIVYAADDKVSEKDWCLLGIKDKCDDTKTPDIFEKIKRLEAAILKGSEVYTPEEIKRLKTMLVEAYETRELMNRY